MIEIIKILIVTIMIIMVIIIINNSNLKDIMKMRLEIERCNMAYVSKT